MCFGRGEMRVAEGRRPEKHEEHDDAEGPQVDLRAREESRQRSPQWTSRLRSPLRRKVPAIWRRFDVWPVCLRVVPGLQQHLAPQNPAYRMANTPRESAPERRACFRQTEVGTGMGGQRSRRSRTCWREGRSREAHDGASQPKAAVASGRAKVGGARAQLRAQLRRKARFPVSDLGGRRR